MTVDDALERADGKYGTEYKWDTEVLAAEVRRLRAMPDVPTDARELAISILDDDFVCTRAWTAWQVGTMREDDFELAREDDCRVNDTITALAAYRSRLLDEAAERGKVVAFKWLEGWWDKYCKIFVVPVGMEVSIDYLDFQRKIAAAVRGEVE